MCLIATTGAMIVALVLAVVLVTAGVSPSYGATTSSGASARVAGASCISNASVYTAKSTQELIDLAPVVLKGTVKAVGQVGFERARALMRAQRVGTRVL